MFQTRGTPNPMWKGPEAPLYMVGLETYKEFSVVDDKVFRHEVR